LFYDHHLQVSPIAGFLDHHSRLQHYQPRLKAACSLTASRIGFPKLLLLLNG
jgi:hypothetical protein